MERIELQLDEKTLEHARKLASAHHATLEELITTIIEQMEATDASGDSLMGMFAHEPELIDQVVESAMQTREKDELRTPVE